MLCICCLLLYQQEKKTELSSHWAEHPWVSFTVRRWPHFPALWKAADAKPEPGSHLRAVLQMQNDYFDLPAFHFGPKLLETVYGSL